MLFLKIFSVGNRIIDSEHRKLHAQINGIAGLIAAGNVGALPDAFGQLENNFHTYFGVEENIARAVNFDFAQHRLAHQRLLNEIYSIKDELIARNGQWSKAEEKNYIDSLWYSFIQHVKDDGKSLKAVMDTYLYDFNPDLTGGVPN